MACCSAHRPLPQNQTIWLPRALLSMACSSACTSGSALHCSTTHLKNLTPRAAPGFGGHYTNKAGRTREGCATFFRRARLRLVQREDVSLKELFAPLLTPAAAGRGARHARFAPMLRASPALAAALQKVRAWQQMPRTSTHLQTQIVSSRMNPFSLFFFGGHCLC